MKKFLIFLVSLVSLVNLANLANLAAQTPFSFDFHGFVNPHYYADSRNVVGGREDMMLFYPKPILLDSLGNDINDGWQANMLAITARLGLRVNGPSIWGAKSGAYIEGDFTGSTNATIDNLRLRHAYFDLVWENYRTKGDTKFLVSRRRLLAGQYWYPMVVHEIMPMTNPLNMGSPFHCYARQPQIRHEYYLLGLETVFAAVWQLDNMSQGLLNGVPSSSTLFARHSLIPEINFQLRWKREKLFLGAAINAKTIQPVVNTSGAVAKHDLHTSLTYSLFGKAILGPVTVKAQTLLNNSLYEGCSLGGYILFPGDNGSYTTRDWHFNTVWLDIERNKGQWRPGIFMGYAKRGTIIESTEDLMTFFIFGRGDSIKQLWRLQPRLTYNTLNGLSFTAEAEYTEACYITNTGDSPVGNLRLSLSATYAF